MSEKVERELLNNLLRYGTMLLESESSGTGQTQRSVIAKGFARVAQDGRWTVVAISDAGRHAATASDPNT